MFPISIYLPLFYLRDRKGEEREREKYVYTEMNHPQMLELKPEIYPGVPHT